MKGKARAGVWTARYDAEREEAWLGKSDGTVAVRARAHRKGLAVDIVRKGFSPETASRANRPRRYIVAGEFGLDEVVAWLIDKTGCNMARTPAQRRGYWSALGSEIAAGRALPWDGTSVPPGWEPRSGPDARRKYTEARPLAGLLLVTAEFARKQEAIEADRPARMREYRRREIVSALADGGLWQKRGRLGWNCPPGFFAHVGIEDFVERGAARGMNAWWIHHLARRRNDAQRIDDIEEEWRDLDKRPSRLVRRDGTPTREALKRCKAASVRGLVRWRHARETACRSIAEGRLPPSPLVTGWERMPLARLIDHMERGHHLVEREWRSWTMPEMDAWRGLVQHGHWMPEDAEGFGEFVRMVDNLPHNEASRGTMDRIAAAGARWTDVRRMDPRTLGELERCEWLLVGLRQPTLRARLAEKA